VTPHVAEFGRLAGRRTEDVLAAQFDIGEALAATLGATVLLKGVPTVITSPGAAGGRDRAERLVSAAGNPVLAAGGSGDILAGIAATLLAQTGAPLESAACAAWVHGHAADIATGSGPVRGHRLDDVLDALPAVWGLADPAPAYPVLADLPAVGESPAS
jgi:NAD(P)H-hydrate epimerase